MNLPALRVAFRHNSNSTRYYCKQQLHRIHNQRNHTGKSLFVDHDPGHPHNTSCRPHSLITMQRSSHLIVQIYPHETDNSSPDCSLPQGTIPQNFHPNTMA